MPSGRTLSAGVRVCQSAMNFESWQGPRNMSKLRAQISVSTDGYVAGPNPTLDNPLGEGGESLHEWAIELGAWREAHGREGGEVNASSQVMEETLENIG